MPNYWSFSAIERFNTCSMKYHLWVDRVIPRPVDTSVAQVAGDEAHQVLETFYGPEVDRMIAPVDLLELQWKGTLENLKILHLLPKLEKFAKDRNDLIYRASAGYRGTDAIRTSEGKVPKKPQDTTTWKNIWGALKMDSRKADIDSMAAAVSPVYGKVSLVDVFAETHIFLDNYEDPIPHHTVLEIELPISATPKRAGKGGERTNLVRIPGLDDDFFTAFIDLVSLDDVGRTIISDHKTSKEAPSSGKVMHWDQLLLYSWAYYELFGEWPNFMAINSLRKGEYVVARVEPELAYRALDRFVQAVKAVKAGNWIEWSPVAFGSPCFNQYFPEPYCAYIEHCHPEFYQLAVAGRI